MLVRYSPLVVVAVAFVHFGASGQRIGCTRNTEEATTFGRGSGSDQPLIINLCGAGFSANPALCRHRGRGVTIYVSSRCRPSCAPCFACVPTCPPHFRHQLTTTQLLGSYGIGCRHNGTTFTCHCSIFLGFAATGVYCAFTLVTAHTAKKRQCLLRALILQGLGLRKPLAHRDPLVTVILGNLLQFVYVTCAAFSHAQQTPRLPGNTPLMNVIFTNRTRTTVRT